MRASAVRAVSSRAGRVTVLEKLANLAELALAQVLVLVDKIVVTEVLEHLLLRDTTRVARTSRVVLASRAVTSVVVSHIVDIRRVAGTLDRILAAVSLRIAASAVRLGTSLSAAGRTLRCKRVQDLVRILRVDALAVVRHLERRRVRRRSRLLSGVRAARRVAMARLARVALRWVENRLQLLVEVGHVRWGGTVTRAVRALARVRVATALLRRATLGLGLQRGDGLSLLLAGALLEVVVLARLVRRVLLLRRVRSPGRRRARGARARWRVGGRRAAVSRAAGSLSLSLIHISEPTRRS